MKPRKYDGHRMQDLRRRFYGHLKVGEGNRLIRRESMFNLLGWVAARGRKWPYKSRAQVTSFWVQGWSNWLRYDWVKP